MKSILFGLGLSASTIVYSLVSSHLPLANPLTSKADAISPGETPSTSIVERVLYKANASVPTIIPKTDSKPNAGITNLKKVPAPISADVVIEPVVTPPKIVQPVTQPIPTITPSPAPPVTPATVVQTVVDKTAPSIPTNVAARATSPTEVKLTWGASSDNEAVIGYEMQRCVGIGCTTFKGMDAPKNPHVTHTGLLPDTQYRYRVRAVDSAQNRSGYSSVVDVRTLKTAVAVISTPTPTPAPTPTPPPTPVPTPSPSPTTGSVLFSDSFANYADGLITNEYAHWGGVNAKVSPHWEMTSGSLFAQGGTGWTGNPDGGIAPNTLSTNANNSAIFRLTTKRNDFQNVSVSFDANDMRMVSTPVTPAVAWDGFHVFLRYQSEEHLYYASVNRRDNKVIIKKKVPGGPSNGGTYHNISTTNAYTVPFNTWQKVTANAKNNSDGSVTIELFVDGKLLVSAVDKGTGGAPITAPGKVGIRADNTNLKFKNFTVSGLK